LQSFYERLLEIDGVDTFSAGQIVADVKFIPPLSEASDWETFVAPGPGSGRFLSVATGGTGAQPLKGYAFAQAFAQVTLK
jgi:hypothetical protein